jgi:hypothetical protein
MHTALCIEDNTIYTAFEFSHLPESELDRKRRLLQCPECHGPAFFRRTAWDGRASCFGARPHSEGCTVATFDPVRYRDVGDDQDDPLQFAGKVIVDLNYGQPEASNWTNTFGEMPGQVDDRHRSTKHRQGGTLAIVHRRVSSLLRTLVQSPALQCSDQLIVVPGQGEMAARDFFVPLLTVTQRHVGEFHGFWGLLSDVRLSNDRSSVWFNSGGLDTISFRLSADQIYDFNQRFQVDGAEDLSGAYILVFGTLCNSAQGKLYCEIPDLDNMALRLT